MDQAPLKPTQNPNSHQAAPYQSMLNESINHFLAKYRNGITDFRDFSTIFSRLLQNMPDPPLQFIWFYSALAFHTAKLEVQKEPSRRSSISRDLFQLLVSFSDNCSSMKRIGILAPVVYELYRLALEEKELKSEVESVLEGIISYCSIFCSKELHEDDDGMTGLDSGFLDVIPVWIVDQSAVVVDTLKAFFPIVSDQFREGIKVGCKIGYLAGIVMCEALLLKLCLKFESGITKAKQEKNLLSLASQTIAGFQNFYFLDILFRMMLEPVLPVISLMVSHTSYPFFIISVNIGESNSWQRYSPGNFGSWSCGKGSENEVLLKEVLCNAAIMVDFSFINPPTGVPIHAKSVKDFAVTWLFVSDLAVQSAREKGDQEKTMSFVNAFSRSCIPLQLINWITSKSDASEKISEPNVSTPLAFIKWLLAVHDQGLTVFDGDTVNLHAKAKFCKSRTEFLLPAIKHNNLDNNVLTDSVNGWAKEDKFDDDTEMVDSMDTGILTADDTMITRSTDGTRKRKEGIEDESKTQMKYMRCHFHENSLRENSIVFGQQ